MFNLKVALPRRTFLRGLGATISLPLLDAMVPSLTAQSKTAAAPVPRLGFVYAPNGFIRDAWVPARAGAEFEFTPSLAALEPFRDKVLVLTGLAQRQADAMGGPPGPHSRSSGAWLSGVHVKQTEGADVRAATTADQLAAAALGKATPLPSLELATERYERMIGNCEAGYSCAYQNTVSWRDETTPLPMEFHPRVVFEQLFGDGTTPVEVREQLRTSHSILDDVSDEIAKLRRRLGVGDSRRLVQYLDSVREIEARIQRAEAKTNDPDVLVPDRPVDIPPFAEHVKLMFDLQVLAYQADITRVITFQLSREQSPMTYPELGISMGHHHISHHGGDPEKLAQKRKVDQYHVQLLSYYAQRLRETPDGDGSLLDHVLIAYGPGIGEPNRHEVFDIPAIILGTGNGTIKPGRHLAFELDRNVPLANLWVAMLDKAGVPIRKVGDSTGPLEGLSGV